MAAACPSVIGLPTRVKVHWVESFLQRQDQDPRERHVGIVAVSIRLTKHSLAWRPRTGHTHRNTVLRRLPKASYGVDQTLLPHHLQSLQVMPLQVIHRVLSTDPIPHLPVPRLSPQEIHAVLPLSWLLLATISSRCLQTSSNRPSGETQAILETVEMRRQWCTSNRSSGAVLTRPTAVRHLERRRTRPTKAMTWILSTRGGGKDGCKDTRKGARKDTRKHCWSFVRRMFSPRNQRRQLQKFLCQRLAKTTSPRNQRRQLTRLLCQRLLKLISPRNQRRQLTRRLCQRLAKTTRYGGSACGRYLSLLTCPDV
ncbi:hypothetical protein JB92DRAFT_503113 [Gautieria morchelliformis]|nr:hypothetical protein JB92DRAFT_503113 [Gautieria morchelliformis]